MKKYIITLCLILTVLFSSTSTVYGATYYTQLGIKITNDNSLVLDKTYYLILENTEGVVISANYYSVYNSTSGYNIYTYNLTKSVPTDSVWDVYIVFEDSKIYHYNGLLGSSIDFSLFEEVVQEEPPATGTIDDTNIVDRLDKIDNSLTVFISLFLFYFGYKIVKEIIFYTKGK